MKSKITSAVLRNKKLGVEFELKTKYDISVGSVININTEIPGRTKIGLSPDDIVPQTPEEYNQYDIKMEANNTVLYTGLSYCYWENSFYLQFAYNDSVIYYNYSDQHQHLDELFKERFTKTN